MLQGEHSAILSNFIKLLFVIKTFVCLYLSGRLRQILLYHAEHSGSVGRASIRLGIKGSLCCVLQQNIVSAALYRFNLQRQ